MAIAQINGANGNSANQRHKWQWRKLNRLSYVICLCKLINSARKIRYFHHEYRGNTAGTDNATDNNATDTGDYKNYAGHYKNVLSLYAAYSIPRR